MSKELSGLSDDAASGGDGVIGPSRVRILWNGAKYGGEPPDPLTTLFERLERYALNPLFEDYGCFATIARGHLRCRPHCEEFGVVGGYEYTGPDYEDAPFAVHFSGNFDRISAGFSIVTDDPDVVEALHEAIHANLQSLEYRQARAMLDSQRCPKRVRISTIRKAIASSPTPGDYGCIPLYENQFRLIPSGRIVDLAEPG